MKIKSATKKQLRTFGIGLAIFLAAIGIVRYLSHHWQYSIYLWIAAAIIFLAALALPRSLNPVYKLAMIIAGALGWINTRILLSIFFYLILTPISLLLKLFRADPLKRKIDINAETYWQPHSERAADKERYFHQF